MSGKRSSGFTLIEMVIAIVIIGAGLAGVLTAFDTVVRSSSDPLIRKQMLAVAEELMEEIQLKRFAADPATPVVNALTACGVAASRTAFDEVGDYNGYTTIGVCDIDGTAVAGLGIYNVRVAAVNQADLGLPVADVWRVTVTVNNGGAEAITLIGWRADYAGGLPP